MNSSLQVNPSRTTTVECSVYDLVGGTPQHFSTHAYTVILIDIIILVVTCPFTVVLNLLTMIAVKMKRRLQSMSNIALACLSTTDFMVGVFVQPLYISVAISALQCQFTSEVCRRKVATKYLTNFFLFSSLAHLAVMSVDRYLAIKHSYTYEQTVTKTRVLIASAIAWMSSSAVLTIHFIDEELFLTVQNLLGLVLLVSVAICSIVVYREAHHQELQIAELFVSVEARERFLKEKRALKLTIIIVVMVFLNFLPIISFRFIVRALKDKVSLDTLHAMYWPAGSFVLLNSFVNPLIYSVRLRQFRIAFTEILLRKNHAEAVEFEMRMFGSQNANQGEAAEQNVNQVNANIAMETNQGGEREVQNANQVNANIAMETNQGGEREEQNVNQVNANTNQGGQEEEQNANQANANTNQGGEEEEQNANQANANTNQGGEEEEQNVNQANANTNQGGEEEEQNANQANANTNQGEEEEEQNANQANANISMKTNQGGERDEQNANQANANTNQGGEKEEQNANQANANTNQGVKKGEQNVNQVNANTNQGGEEEEQNANQANANISMKTNQGGERDDQNVNQVKANSNHGGEKEEQSVNQVNANTNQGGEEEEQHFSQANANIAMETNQRGEREEQNVNQANANINQGEEGEEQNVNRVNSNTNQEGEEEEQNVNKVNANIAIETNQGGDREEQTSNQMNGNVNQGGGREGTECQPSEH